MVNAWFGADSRMASWWLVLLADSIIGGEHIRAPISVQVGDDDGKGPDPGRKGFAGG